MDEITKNDLIAIKTIMVMFIIITTILLLFNRNLPILG